jgi:hypothetical protein
MYTTKDKFMYVILKLADFHKEMEIPDVSRLPRSIKITRHTSLASGLQKGNTATWIFIRERDNVYTFEREIVSLAVTDENIKEK